jgi:hypothetical protein
MKEHFLRKGTGLQLENLDSDLFPDRSELVFENLLPFFPSVPGSSPFMVLSVELVAFRRGLTD